MAKGNKKAAAAAETNDNVVDLGARRVQRAVDPRHEDLAAYIQEQTGYAADARTVQLAFNMRNEYRKTDRYKNLVAQMKTEKQAAEEEAKAARKAEKAAAKTKASEEDGGRKGKAKASGKAGAAATKGKKAASGKARKGKAKAQADEDPFDE